LGLKFPNRHTDEDEYTFVPAHSGAQALSIRRYEGDIVLNGASAFISALEPRHLSRTLSPEHTLAIFAWAHSVRHRWDYIPFAQYAQRSCLFSMNVSLRLMIADYLIVITGRENCGPLHGHDVYHATDFEVLPISPDINTKNPAHAVEEHLLALVRGHLKSGYFLFSYGADITRRMQAQWESQEKDRGKALWEVVSAETNAERKNRRI
jgi:hypothetical protein